MSIIERCNDKDKALYVMNNLDEHLNSITHNDLTDLVLVCLGVSEYFLKDAIDSHEGFFNFNNFYHIENTKRFISKLNTDIINQKDIDSIGLELVEIIKKKNHFDFVYLEPSYYIENDYLVIDVKDIMSIAHTYCLFSYNMAANGYVVSNIDLYDDRCVRFYLSSFINK